MAKSDNFLVHSPGGDNEGNLASDTNKDKKNHNQQLRDLKEEDNENKPLSEKIHDALQEWSNDDQRDQEFDDTRP